MKAVLLPVAVALLTAAAAGADSPPPEYIDKGACPFECCVYRTWDTKTDTVVYAQPERNARIVGLLKAGAAVEAITGEVHATPARFLVKRRHGEHKPGEVLWVYTYLGEGHFRVWWNGAMHDVDLGFSPYGGSPGARCEDSQQCWGELERALRFTWWVKVRSKEGWDGWSDQPEHFGNKDACGERPSGTKIEKLLDRRRSLRASPDMLLPLRHFRRHLLRRARRGHISWHVRKLLGGRRQSEAVPSGLPEPQRPRSASDVTVTAGSPRTGGC